MAKQTFTLYITQSISQWNSGKISVNDFNRVQSFNGKPAESILLAIIEQEFDIPDVDLVAAQIDGLEQAVQHEKAESQARINFLIDRISKLKAIGHEVEA